jgi:hypothetical protein
MITPSYSITATERVLPNLALDFTTASLDARVTFTRTTDATHPASYVASTGYITAATDNQARFDYDPIALTCKGLLIEESRANLLLYSQDFSQAYYNKTRGVIDTVNFVTSPANDSTGRIFTCNTTSGSGFYIARTTITISSASPVSKTVFFKKGTNNWAQITLSDGGANGIAQWFNLATGVVASSTIYGTGWAKTSASMTLYANGWYRCQLSVSTTGTTVRLDCFPCVSSDGGSGCTSGDIGYIWGAQIEAGAFPTSYVVTNGASLTRNADVATMTGTNFSSWYNTTAGSIVFDYNVPTTITYGPVGSIGQDTFNTSMNFNFVNAARATGTSFPNLVTCGTAVLGVNKMAVSLKVNDYASYVNGAFNGTDTTGTMIPVTSTQFNIGRTEATDNIYANGWIRKIFYYPQRLTNAELAAFSK